MTDGAFFCITEPGVLFNCTFFLNFFYMIKRLYQFLVYDIWRITGAELSRTRRYFYSFVKTLVLAIRGFERDHLMVKASALTYYTLFAIVPVFALIFAIGRGFGIQRELMSYLAVEDGMTVQLLHLLMEFVERYLENAKGGLFVGIGIVFLLWSVISAFRHIEKIFNDIWQVKKDRSLVIQFTTYFSMVFLLPILILTSSGLSILLQTIFSNEEMFGELSHFLIQTIKILPYVLNSLIFTALYAIIPNTQVRFSSALIAGIFTGVMFQIFQLLYIKGQVFLTSYNVVYGGFAVIPLLLLWLQISWLIVLLGAELSFSVQNFSNFDFEFDLKKMSRRYHDFLLLSVMTLIVKRFVEEKEPYTSEMLSSENEIPIRLVKNSVNQLVDAGLLIAIDKNHTRVRQFFPAIDVSKLTVADFFERLNTQGEDLLQIEQNEHLTPYWNVLQNMIRNNDSKSLTVLLKDL